MEEYKSDNFPDIVVIDGREERFSSSCGPDARLYLTQVSKRMLVNIVLDAKSLYDGYPSKHYSELYKFTKELLRVLQ